MCVCESMSLKSSLVALIMDMSVIAIAIIFCENNHLLNPLETRVSITHSVICSYSLITIDNDTDDFLAFLKNYLKILKASVLIVATYIVVIYVQIFNSIVYYTLTSVYHRNIQIHKRLISYKI